MSSLRRTFHSILFALLAVVTTAMFHVLGAPLLLALRRRLGRWGYWAFVLPFSGVLFAGRLQWLALVFANLSILMGVFEEFAEGGFGFSSSFFLALLIDALLSAGSFALWVVSVGSKWSQVLQDSIETSLKPVKELYPNLPINYAEIVSQLPSLVLIYGILALFISILAESRFNDGKRPPMMRPQLEVFRAPDVCVWIFIGSLLGTFGGFHVHVVEILSVNAMNVCVGLFFIQGMMVLLKAFDALRMGTVWQTIFGTMIALQLFMFVSLVGLLDFWFGFRERLAKRAERFKQET